MNDETAGEVTRALREIEDGDKSAVDRLLPHIYKDLRALAGHIFRQQSPEQTIQPTALVHEAYLRLVGTENPGWTSRKHFFDVAAMAMRQLLCSQARKRTALKRGGTQQRVELTDDEFEFAPGGNELDVIALNDALERLEEVDARQARVISLKYFAGLTENEIAELLEVSDRTVRLDCRMARSWLQREIERGHSAGS